MIRFRLLLLALTLCPMLSANPGGLRKLKDVVVYQDARFHCAFPSVVRLADGRLLLAFRRAPNRRIFGEERNDHVDPNSYLVAVSSADGGETWTKEPRLLYADAFGGSQDPCLLRLRDGTLLCASYGWSFVRPDGLAHLRPPVSRHPPGAVFNGGYYVRSTDDGATWAGPFHPPHIAPEILRGPTGELVPAYNRGALAEGRDGRLFWAVAATEAMGPQRTGVHLLVSDDRGATWRYAAPIATDARVSFNETSIYETPRGDLVAFLRTAGYDDQACIARSTDGGKSFQPWQGMGFQGHPLHALRLPDNRVLLTYGYRHQPMGVRARILDAECSDFATAPEIVLRDDGGGFDLGYSWSVLVDPHHVFVAYYFNVDGGVPFIAGTLLALD